MGINLKGRDFLKLADFNKQEVLYLIELSKKLKLAKQNKEVNKCLLNKNIALIFEKTSSRTRCAFEVASYDLGMNVTYLDSISSQIGHKESIKDSARLLSKLYDAIEYRGYGQNIIEELAKYSEVPVFNGLTNEFHPTQMLADLLTMLEFSDKKLEDISFAYLGDAQNNMGNSLLHLGALMGMDVRIAAPEFLLPNNDWIDYCTKLAQKSGARVLITSSVEEAVSNVDFIHTDVWVSMGEPEEKWYERIESLKSYRVDGKIVQLSKNDYVKVMHCLPSYHNRETAVGAWVYEKFGLNGVEITDEIFEDNSEIIFTQAENRMHTIKAILASTLKD